MSITTGHPLFAECRVPTALGKGFAECRKNTWQRFTLGKMKIRKNPKIIANFFFRGRPLPASARPSPSKLLQFLRKIRG